jgi:hypothetical protein
LSHAAPEQQPGEQEAESHAHVPLLQYWPEAHGGPVPHSQLPPTHWFAVMPQFWHAAPFVPHAEGVGGEVQVGPEQHPDGQVAELHPVQTPPEHVPGLQFAHSAPPVPQALLPFPPWQTFP